MWVRANRLLFERWQDISNTVVIVSAPDADELDRLVARANSAGVPVSAFTDDDLGHRLTAVALGPCDCARKLCQKYDLAFKEVRQKAA